MNKNKEIKPTTKSIIFYKSYYDGISQLDKESQLQVYDSLFGFVFNGIEFNTQQLTPFAKTTLDIIYPQIASSIKKYLSKVGTNYEE